MSLFEAVVSFTAGAAFGLAACAEAHASRARRDMLEFKASIIDLLSDTTRTLALMRGVIKEVPSREQLRELIRNFSN